MRSGMQGRAPRPPGKFQFIYGYEPLGVVHQWNTLYVNGWLKPPADQLRDQMLVDQEKRY